MSGGFELLPQDGGPRVALAPGETVIGRGPLLGVSVQGARLAPESRAGSSLALKASLPVLAGFPTMPALSLCCLEVWGQHVIHSTLINSQMFP